jgi:hypothetical protein
MRTIPASELIINDDGSIFHLHLHPGQLADTVILVGDPGRVAGMQVQVKNRTVVVDNQFGSGNGSHNCRFLISIIGIKVIYLPRISKLRSEFFINISIRKTE